MRDRHTEVLALLRQPLLVNLGTNRLGQGEVRRHRFQVLLLRIRKDLIVQLLLEFLAIRRPQEGGRYVIGRSAVQVEGITESPAAQETKRAALLAELQQVEEEQRRFAARIAAADDIDVLARDFQDAERRRRQLRDQLAALDRRPQVCFSATSRVSSATSVLGWRTGAGSSVSTPRPPARCSHS